MACWFLPDWVEATTKNTHTTIQGLKKKKLDVKVSFSSMPWLLSVGVHRLKPHCRKMHTHRKKALQFLMPRPPCLPHMWHCLFLKMCFYWTSRCNSEKWEWGKNKSTADKDRPWGVRQILSQSINMWRIKRQINVCWAAANIHAKCLYAAKASFHHSLSIWREEGKDSKAWW